MIESIEWLDADFTQAVVTVRAHNYRWWRKRYARADVVRAAGKEYEDVELWRFVTTNARVIDSLWGHYARPLENERNTAIRRRADTLDKMERVLNGNPWTPVEPVPEARVVSTKSSQGKP